MMLTSTDTAPRRPPMSNLTTEELEDMIGDAGACSDHECGCKVSAQDARDELAARGIA
jgi:hypothetical protein